MVHENSGRAVAAGARIIEDDTKRSYATPSYRDSETRELVQT
jgi:hypothetical protein